MELLALECMQLKIEDKIKVIEVKNQVARAGGVGGNNYHLKGFEFKFKNIIF